ncbi:MAG: hypothetical protein AAGB51_02700 [Planctomycetota bacterium]
MRPQRLTEFSIYVEDRPGELAGVLDAVGARGVEIEAMKVSTNTSTGKGIIRLVGSPTEDLRASLESLVETGLGPLTEAEVLSVGLERRPNAFRDIAVHFAPKGINVLYAYLAPANNGHQARCVLRVDDLDAAERAIEALG